MRGRGDEGRRPHAAAGAATRSSCSCAECACVRSEEGQLDWGDVVPRLGECGRRLRCPPRRSRRQRPARGGGRRREARPKKPGQGVKPGQRSQATPARPSKSLQPLTTLRPPQRGPPPVSQTPSPLSLSSYSLPHLGDAALGRAVAGPCGFGPPGNGPREVPRSLHTSGGAVRRPGGQG
jgi:hypothetical protein